MSSEVLPILVIVLTALAAIASVAAYSKIRGFGATTQSAPAVEHLTQHITALSQKVDAISTVLRQELAQNRGEASQNAALLRSETGTALSDARISTEAKLDRFYQTLQSVSENSAVNHLQFRERVDALLTEFKSAVETKLVNAAETQVQRNDLLAQRLSAFGEALDRKQNDFRETVDTLTSVIRLELTKVSEVVSAFQNLVDQKLSHSSESQGSRMDAFAAKLASFGETLAQRQEDFRKTIDDLSSGLREELSKMATLSADQQGLLRDRVQADMDALRKQNDAKLDEIRGTVDERLQKTLEHRLGESFKIVSERLEQVHAGLGEMQALASNVGDLKRVLGNVKTRGIFGEVQLKALIEDLLSPDQYEENCGVGKGTGERVEFAVRMPGKMDSILLPIDSKFSQEPYEALLNAYESGEAEQIRKCAEALARVTKNHAKDISKYINPPHTTDFAVMFLPTEGLHSEVLRIPGLADSIRREQRIIIAGPTMLSALLLSLQVGFRTLAIEKRSSEVWQILGGVKNEFGKFGDVLSKVRNRLERAQQDIGDVETRTRAINRRLTNVEALPETESTLLHISGNTFGDPMMDPEISPDLLPVLGDASL